MSEAGYDLDRFGMAQNPLFEAVLAELRAARKRTHWMWFIFPQLRALGRSPRAHFYGLASLAEARAYLVHPTLGPRLDLCTRTVLEARDVPLHAIFGNPDDMKFRSSMTLFAKAAAAPDPFQAALDRFCGGEPDAQTLALIDAEPGEPT